MCANGTLPYPHADTSTLIRSVDWLKHCFSVVLSNQRFSLLFIPITDFSSIALGVKTMSASGSSLKEFKQWLRSAEKAV